MCDPEIWNVCCRHWVDIAQERAHGCYRKQGHRAGPPSPAGAWVMPLCAPYLNMEHEHGFTIYPDKDKYWSCFGPIFPICDPTFPFWDGNVSCVSLYIGKIYFVFWYRGPHFRVCLSLRRDFGLNFLNCILLFIFGVCVYVCACIYVCGGGAHACAMECMLKPEDNLRESALSFHHVGPRVSLDTGTFTCWSWDFGLLNSVKI